MTRETLAGNMNAITKLFLRSKHWQIFLLLFGVFFAGQVAVISSFAVAARSAEDFGKTGQLIWVVTLVFSYSFSVGSGRWDRFLVPLFHRH